MHVITIQKVSDKIDSDLYSRLGRRSFIFEQALLQFIASEERKPFTEQCLSDLQDARDIRDVLMLFPSPNRAARN